MKKIRMRNVMALENEGSENEENTSGILDGSGTTGSGDVDYEIDLSGIDVYPDNNGGDSGGSGGSSGGGSSTGGDNNPGGSETSDGNPGTNGEGGGGSGGGGSNETPIEEPEGDYPVYTEKEVEELMKKGKWEGGFVEGLGYVLPEVKCIANHIPPQSSSDYIVRAKSFEGTPYLLGGTSRKGIDCSGLISAACNLKKRWTTSSGDIPGFRKIKAATKEEFWKTVKKGDILVWKGRHAVIFLGGTSIYHSHSSGVNQTNDLKSYWMGFGIPTIYRK